MKSLLAVIFFGLIAIINTKIDITNIPEMSYIFSCFDNDEKAGLPLEYMAYIFTLFLHIENIT
jgi:hypothetical protein